MCTYGKFHFVHVWVWSIQCELWWNMAICFHLQCLCPKVGKQYFWHVSSTILDDTRQLWFVYTWQLWFDATWQFSDISMSKWTNFALPHLNFSYIFYDKLSFFLFHLAIQFHFSMSTKIPPLSLPFFCDGITTCVSHGNFEMVNLPCLVYIFPNISHGN